MPDNIQPDSNKKTTPKCRSTFFQTAATVVEFAIAMGLIGVVVASLVFYVRRYKEVDEELLVQDIMQLGRMQPLQPLLVLAQPAAAAAASTSNAGIVAEIPAASNIADNTFAAQVGAYIQSAYVPHDLALSGRCKEVGDIRVFFVRVEGQVGKIGTPTILGAQVSNPTTGERQEETYDCKGETILKGALGADENSRVDGYVAEVVEGYGDGGVIDGEVFSVAYSSTKPMIPANIAAATKTANPGPPIEVSSPVP